jgi:NAD(P)-dependent dehydrogenase (short-subunit alcohol dehydrogenase family)
LRTPASTSKPSPARCAAVDSPIPVDAPVTTTLPPLTVSNLSDQPLEGRTVVVTGASSGIGAAGAEELGRLGAEVAPVGRDERRLTAVAKRIERAAEPLTADFASLDEVRSLADRLLERHPRIHVLVNNAGTISGRREQSEDGYELVFAVNHLAPFLLTNLLLARLRESAPARVVTTSSIAHAQGRLELDDLQLERDWSLGRSYGNSKLANVFFTRALARRIEDDRVVANCFHPGTIRTRIARDTGLVRAVAWKAATMFAGSPASGAKTLVHLAASPEGGEVSGRYFVDSKPGRIAGRAEDDELAEQLWEVSEELTGIR